MGRGDQAARLRPTADRVRESLFNLLTNGRQGDLVAGARVLDLFAGTGALGLEALSRGAAHATFVDDGRAAQALIRANLDRARLREAAILLPRDVTRLGPCPTEPFDLVFLDPPYRRGLGERAITAARAGGWLAPGAVVVWEEGGAVSALPGLGELDRRRYGNTAVTILQLEPDDASPTGP